MEDRLKAAQAQFELGGRFDKVSSDLKGILLEQKGTAIGKLREIKNILDRDMTIITAEMAKALLKEIFSMIENKEFMPDRVELFIDMAQHFILQPQAYKDGLNEVITALLKKHL